MDGAGDSRVVDASTVLDAINTQVLEQIRHLAPGPLAVAVAQSLQAAIEHQHNIRADVLDVRVLFEDRLYRLCVSVSVAAE